MRTSTLSALVVAALGVGLGTTAGATTARTFVDVNGTETARTTVHYSDLDVHTRHGADELYSRINMAAVRVCESGDGVPDEQPLHGYYFRVVPARAGRPSAGGVTFVAYPAEYRATGVMTFVVTRDGAVWEKDLGPETPSLASRLTSRASGWRAVDAHG